MRYWLIILCAVLLTACGEQNKEQKSENVEKEIEMPEYIKNARAMLDNETETRTSDEVLGKKSKPLETHMESEEDQEIQDEQVEEPDKTTDEWTDKSSESFEKLNAIGDITFKKNGNNVEMFIPAALAKNATQDKIDKEIKEKGYKSGKINSDGSVTYVIPKNKHEEMMKETKEDLISDIMKNSNVLDVKLNDDLSVIEIYLKSEPTDEDKMLKVSAPIQAHFYYMLAGYTPENTEVRLLSSTGELY